MRNWKKKGRQGKERQLEWDFIEETIKGQTESGRRDSERKTEGRKISGINLEYK